MSDDEKKDIKDQLNRIERCLTGDDDYGQMGLVKQVRYHGTRLNRIERAGVYVAGAGGFIVLAWTVWTQWPRK